MNPVIANHSIASRSIANHRDVLGRQGEQLAAQYLSARGLTVIGRNWRCPIGEIDIIAREARTLVVCEVKTRSGSRLGSPLEAVTPAKARRLRRLAAAWAAAHPGSCDQIRIDVIGVLRAGPGRFSIEHVPGIG